MTEDDAPGEEEEVPIPAVVPVSDAEETVSDVVIDIESSSIDWQDREFTSSESSDERTVNRQLTPDDVDIERPDEYAFEYIHTKQLPTGIQYTPEFDPKWVYTAGSSDGGSQDDAPVQGLEIGVVATAECLEQTVLALLRGIGQYYNETGQYPRHRFIKSRDEFVELGNGEAGPVAIFQPAPDRYTGLVKHMNAVQTNAADAVDSNVRTAHQLVQYLAVHLKAAELADWLGDLPVSDVIDWEYGKQVGELPIAERYAPLGAGEVYDPAIDNLDLSTDGVESVADTDLSPTMLDIDTTEGLFNERDFS